MLDNKFFHLLSLGITIVTAVFLGIQTSILSNQTEALTASVRSQERTYDLSEDVSKFENRRFLLTYFRPDLRSQLISSDYSDKLFGFEFKWSLENQGNNTLAVSHNVVFDLVRCSNEEIWVSEGWESRQSLMSSVDATTTPGDIDYFDEGYDWWDLYPGIEREVAWAIDFPSSAFANFVIGEKVAIEVFGIVFDPEQQLFREELIELDWSHRGDLFIRGSRVVFPAIRNRLSLIAMFQLTSDGWISIENEGSCTAFLYEDNVN